MGGEVSIFEWVSSWVRLFRSRLDKFPDIDILNLARDDFKELRASEELGVPFFMRIDEKRWCQASV